ncbi:hypothetical protein [Coleofasciculus chthonoplastes]|nr:hypothetical protein [Coleofasciculus chthonoplastes]
MTEGRGMKTCVETLHFSLYIALGEVKIPMSPQIFDYIWTNCQEPQPKAMRLERAI